MTTAPTVFPDDQRYADLVSNWNTRFTGIPDYVRVPTDAGEVVDAVGDAVRAGTRLAVRSGGHGVEGFANDPDVRALIELSQLNRVGFDQERSAFLVEPGVSLRTLYQTLYARYGVTIPGGGSPAVAAGGHLVGGGIGALARRMGTVAEYLYGVEVVVVDADGRARLEVATRDHDDPNRELWWAHTGGGGGNFGVVTKYWLRTPDITGTDPTMLLPHPPRQSHVRRLAWPMAKLTERAFSELIHRFTGWFANHSAPDSPGIRLSTDLWLLHRNTQIGRYVVMNVQVDPTEPDGERLFDEFRAEVIDPVGFPPVPVLDRVMPWLESVRLLSHPDTGEGGVGRRTKDRTAYLRTGFTDAQLATAYRYLTSEDYPASMASMRLISHGGRVNAIAPDATAVAQRDSILTVQHMAAWTDPSADDKHLAWVREFYRDFYADSGGVPELDGATDGCHINWPDIDLTDPDWNTSGIPWSRLYYKDNYPRLQVIKSRWDPGTVFHHAMSIEPA